MICESCQSGRHNDCEIAGCDCDCSEPYAEDFDDDDFDDEAGLLDDDLGDTP